MPNKDVVRLRGCLDQLVRPRGCATKFFTMEKLIFADVEVTMEKLIFADVEVIMEKLIFADVEVIPPLARVKRTVQTISCHKGSAWKEAKRVTRLPGINSPRRVCPVDPPKRRALKPRC